jgi:hypothetical protein
MERPCAILVILDLKSKVAKIDYYNNIELIPCDILQMIEFLKYDLFLFT